MDPRTDINPFIQSGFKIYRPKIHSSTITQYQTCPRKFMYSELLHLQPKGYYASALSVGSIYHRYMECFYSGVSTHDADFKIAAHMTKTVDDLLKDADALGILPNGKSVNTIREHMTKDHALARAMALWSWHFSPFPPTTSTDKWAVVAVELSVETPQIAGRLDMILRNKDTGRLWIVDHKTTSQSPAHVSGAFKFAIQPFLYRKLAAAHFSEDPAGIIHNVIRKPRILLKSSQTLTDYAREVIEWYEGDGKWKKNAELHELDPPFVRSIIHFTDTPATESQLQLEEVSAASRANLDPDRFPRYAHSCFAWNRPCPYLPICQADKVRWGTIAKEHYNISHRDDIEGEQE